MLEAALAERDWLGWERREAPAASEEQLELVHIARLRARGPRALRRRAAARSTPTPRSCRESWPAALHAAGGAVRDGAGAARRRGAGRATARSGPRATTPNASGRWASACSTTSPSPPRGDRRARRSSGCSCSTGTSTTATAPPRSSATRARRAVREHPPVAAVPRDRPARRTPAAGRGRATRSTCRCRPGTGSPSCGWSCSSASWCPAARAPSRRELILVSAGFDAHAARPARRTACSRPRRSRRWRRGCARWPRELGVPLGARAGGRLRAGGAGGVRLRAAAGARGGGGGAAEAVPTGEAARRAGGRAVRRAGGRSA